MLISGKFKDNKGVIHHVPLMTGSKLSPEQQIVNTAHGIAWSKGIQVVKVWGTDQKDVVLPTEYTHAYMVDHDQVCTL